ncbi:MAG: CTAG/PCC1 family protein [Candidatus Marsarchaeota archaeon]|nr:CTAG/PCC1 family protein [Candidatus Marsarchaeota archaeon]
MPSATIKLALGPRSKDYVRIVGKGAKYKRGSLSFNASKDSIEIKVEASDPVALLASVSSAVKQLKVVTSVDSLIK